MLTHGLFSTMGQIKHTPIITYHQIDDTNQSIRVKFYYYSAIYFCAKKREEISEEREKNTNLFYEEESPSKHLQQKKIEKKIEKKKEKDLFRASMNTYIYNSFSTMCLFSQEYIVTLLKQGLV